MQPFRIAKEEDIPSVVELWANHASIRQLQNSKYWRWQTHSGLLWEEYLRKLMHNPQYCLSICDFEDNGLTGFLLVRIEALPPYYLPQYKIICQEFYIRPKEKSSELFKELLLFTVKHIQEALNLVDNNGFLVQIESTKLEDSLISSLKTSHQIELIMQKYIFHLVLS